MFPLPILLLALGVQGLPTCTSSTCRGIAEDYSGDSSYLLQVKTQSVGAASSGRSALSAPQEDLHQPANKSSEERQLGQIQEVIATKDLGLSQASEQAVRAAAAAHKSESADVSTTVTLNVARWGPLGLAVLLVAGIFALSAPASAFREEIAKYIAEFLGTFVLVLTVVCCINVGNAVWNATSIACALMIMIYSTGFVSGGNLNPAVSLALAFTGNLSWPDMAKYCLAQVAGGVAAVGLGSTFFGTALELAPIHPFTGVHALLAEAIYSCVLCFVVLNCAASKRNNDAEDGNQFFALAIGFVIVAGGYAVGGVSGAAFNPAVALALDLEMYGAGWGIWYCIAELTGASLAAVLYRLVRPEDLPGQDVANYTPTLVTKLLSEFLGAFVLVLTVGLNVVNGSPATAWSAAAALMCMIYSLGNVSGAHFNPAVTVACVARGKCTLSDGVGYSIAQTFGGLVAGAIAAVYHAAGPYHATTFALQPGEGFSFASMAFAELFFTFVLAYVVLAVATTKPPESQVTSQNFYYGLAIASCVTAGGFAIGSVSGGELNPAVSVGISALSIFSPGAVALPPVTYLFGNILMELIGGICAATLYRFTHPKEFNPDASEMPAKLLCEFIGTYVLVFTVGCCVLAGSGVWNATAIAAVLMSMIYAVGPVSGGHLNPAVSFALGISRNMKVADVFKYWAMQFLGGAAAGCTYLALFSPRTATLEPVAPFTSGHALLAEAIYTCVLCFVVLNCAASKQNNPASDGNQFFALAIGFVIIAGGYAAGGISGACFNPAVALGVDIQHVGTGWGIFWALAELVGAVAAAGLYALVRPKERSDADKSDTSSPSLLVRCFSEFVGVFVLMLTGGLNGVMLSPAGAWSTAASLMCMIYSLGSVSGAHLNPAVTLAVLASGREKIVVKDSICYIICQSLAAAAAGLLASSYGAAVTPGGRHMPAPGHAPNFSELQAGMAECAFTAVLAYVVLSVATTKAPIAWRTKQNFFFGLAIASAVTAGGVAIGAVSGGLLNPAVGLGLSIEAGSFGNCGIFAAWELLGGLLAALVFRMTHCSEYESTATPLKV